MHERPEEHLPPRRWSRYLSEGALLFGMWLLLSGHYDYFHLGLGVLSVALVLWIDRDIAYISSDEAGLQHRMRVGRLLLYIPWIAWEMVISAVHVAAVVLSPRMPINPQLVRFSSDQPNVLATVILGNSITLTPGTLIVDVEGREFLVHCLTEKTAAGVLSGSMQRKVAGLFTGVEGEMVHHVERDAGPQGEEQD